ncbi:cell wall hydrolase [Stakelama sp. CBK3Z-3]|uniref:Cell wall hydrolase n=2 Tax=Stakelama flava TaxID=2860338 RepID=A0ABS6XI79_9SPHN|nr:cell wall hydrolase [Stakelama flava]
MVAMHRDSDPPLVAPETLAQSADRPVGAVAPENTVATDPAELAPLSPEDAVARNARIPIVKEARHPAPAFHIGKVNAVDYARALDCLSAAVYYEAGGETIEGQRGVAQVVLNRVRHPAYPNTICGVVFQGAQRNTGCQFTFTCDGSLAHSPVAGRWKVAQGVALAALEGSVEPEVGLATHYHANYVLPLWSPKLTKLAAIDHHIFLRWAGSWGEPGAFSQRYRGGEPAIDWRNTGEDAEGTAQDDALDSQSQPVNSLPVPLGRPLLPMKVPQEAAAPTDDDNAKPPAYVAPDERRVIFAAPSPDARGGATTNTAAPPQ